MKSKIIKNITVSAILCTTILYAAPVFALTKEETVYSKLDSNGNVYETIVSDSLKNSEQEKEIKDISDLLEIKNTNGDETFKQSENNLTWDADGRNIYYQGKTQKELPIECKVKYELDGKEIEPKELAGKAGKVKITIEYTNKDEHIVNINGKSEKMYTPFVVVCGAIIKNDENKNIEINNGKVIDNGSKSIVMGISLPGLKESLGLEDEKIKIPNTIEITMESTNFEMGNIITYVTPKILEENDLSLFNNIDDIYNKVDTLQESSKKLVEGANTLQEGTNQLNNGANELSNGVSSAYTGAQTIQSEVSKSAKNLQTDNTEVLDSQTLNAIKTQAEAQAKAIIEQQKAGIKAKAEAEATLTNEQIEGIKALAMQGIDEASIKQTAASSIDDPKTTAYIKGKADSQIDEMIKGLSAAGINIPDAVVAQLKAKAETEAITNAKAIAQDTAVKTAKIVVEKTAVGVATQTAKTSAGETAVETAKQVAEQTAGKTSTEVATKVANQAKETFSNKVVAQLKTLENGLYKLTNGLSQLNDGSKTLSNGTSTLSEGVTTLAEGLTKFDSEGIEPICNYINGDLKDVQTKVEKLKELSEQYNNFTMLDSQKQGNVKFIMIMDQIRD